MERAKIESVLLNLGVPSSIKGFRYITDALMLLDVEGWEAPYWTELYRVVGEMNQTTASRTERAIRHAFDVCRKHSRDAKTLEYYIGMDNKNSGSLSQLHTRLKQEENLVSQDEESVVGGGMYISHQELRTLIREEVIYALKTTCLEGVCSAPEKDGD